MSANPSSMRTGQETIHLVPVPVPPAPKKHDPNPLIVTFVAFIAAFHVAAFITGLMVAWIFYSQHSGAFAW